MVKSLLHEVLRRQKGNDVSRGGKLPDNVKLPVMTLRDMHALDDQLQSNDTYSQLVCVELKLCQSSMLIS